MRALVQTGFSTAGAGRAIGHDDDITGLVAMDGTVVLPLLGHDRQAAGSIRFSWWRSVPLCDALRACGLADPGLLHPLPRIIADGCFLLEPRASDSKPMKTKNKWCDTSSSEASSGEEERGIIGGHRDGWYSSMYRFGYARQTSGLCCLLPARALVDCGDASAACSSNERPPPLFSNKEVPGVQMQS